MNRVVTASLKQYGLLTLAVVLAVAIFAFDLSMELGVAAAAPYFLVILLGIWIPHKHFIPIAVGVTIVLTILGVVISPSGGEFWKVGLNRLFAILGIVVMALLVLREKKLLSFKDKNQRLGRELEIRKEHLQNLDNKFQAILESAGTGIFGVDMEGITTFINPAGARVLGYSAEEIIGRPIHGLLGYSRAGKEEFPFSSVSDAVSESESFRGKHYFITKQGTCIPVSLVAKPILEQNQIKGSVVVFENLYELEKTRSQLKDHKRWVMALIENSADSMVVIDDKGVVEFFNPAAEKLFGYNEQEVVGKNVKILIAEPERTHHDGYIRRYLETGYAKIIGLGREVKGRTRSGEHVDLFLTITEFEFEDRRHFLGTLHDISQQKEHERKLIHQTEAMETLNRNLIEEIQRRNVAEDNLKRAIENLNRKVHDLDRFAYITSHDLKAPLRGIANLADWIEQDMEEGLDEDVKSHIEKMKGRVQRLESLINGILEYSRASRSQSKEETLDIGRMLKEIVDMLPHPPGISIKFEESIPSIEGERTKVQQIFINLIQNAIKHHDREAGNIWISGSEVERGVEFRVEDDGPGIAPEFRDRVFEIFQTLEARDKKEATGIGLALVKKIILDRGGRIYIEGREPRGCAFCFVWPASVSENLTVVADQEMGNHGS